MNTLIFDNSEFEFDIESNINKSSFNRYRIFSSLGVLFYIWLLPLLSNYGFAENGTSISEFISNAHATGALAALSFTPLCLMWEYQNIYLINKYESSKYIYFTLSGYQFFYGCFLVCTVNYVPDWLHFTTVFLFCTNFVIHSLAILYLTKYSTFGKIDLIIGLLACLMLLFVKGIWFWAFECIGFTSMILFTPIEIFSIKNT